MRIRQSIGSLHLVVFLLTFSFLGFENIGSLHGNDHATGWKSDIECLAKELPARHINLFFKISPQDFSARIKNLLQNCDKLDAETGLVEMMRLVAAVGDSHTAVSYRPQTALPLMLYWFKDGIYITNAVHGYSRLLNKRLEGIGGAKLEFVLEKIRELIPAENESQFHSLAPSFLIDPVILRGLGLLGKEGAIAVNVVDDKGIQESMECLPVSFAKPPMWLVAQLAEAELPLYLRNRQLCYWYQLIPEKRALYFKYNSCQEIPGNSFREFSGKLLSEADKSGVESIVVDFRHNGGGNSGIFSAFLDELRRRPQYTRKGALKVIIGRRTFSSAVLNVLELIREFNPLIIGERSGGKPNHYGEIEYMTLPASGLRVSYSTKFFRVCDKDTDAIIPDIHSEISFQDYLSGRDPVLERALRIGKASGGRSQK